MAGRHRQQSQRGAALLVFLVLLVMGALTWVVSNLTPESVEAARARQTADALAQARDALLGYALKHRDAQAAKDADTSGLDDRSMYGYLPLPDLGSSRNQNLDPICLDGTGNPVEGCDANYFTGLNFDTNGIGPTVVGRFPWRTLGMAPPRDGHGECLWLIVSGLHSRILRASPPPAMPLPPLNWDTPGQLDIVIANGTGALNSLLANAHERPVAIIFAPGPPLPGQDRSTSATDDVTQCGGNYNAANYLDPVTAAAMGGVTNYLAGTNAASGSTGDSNPANDPDAAKPMLTEGKVYATGGNFLPNACTGASCNLMANDTGLRITADSLFGALRKNANFRIDINSLLDRMVNCLRDELASGNSLVNGKIAGANNNACYGEDVHPLGYYPHWREMVFVAAPATVNAASCAGALLFAGQRAASQQRVTPADKNAAANYLEGTNLTEFLAATNSFSGPDLFERVGPGQTASQDIVRCIPVGGTLNEVISPALNALGGQIVDYNPGTRTLTLGRIFSITSAQRTASAGAFFGCSWTPEVRLLGSGLRSYFKFSIIYSGHGFSFAVIDGNNSANVCGAEAEQLGYSGSNLITPPIGYPKIGLEIDTSKNTSRDDPVISASGQTGHAAIVYWGGEATVDDDNVHGLPAPPMPSRPAPRNPPPGDVSTADSGITYLPGSSLPTNIDIHVRVEVRRLTTNDAQHSNTYQIDAWIEKGNLKTDVISAMRNTTRPLDPNTAADIHLRDTPTVYDIQGGVCSPASPCPSANQVCGTDNLCYTKSFYTARLGFTTSQSSTSSSKDQTIYISDFFTTWIP